MSFGITSLYTATAHAGATVNKVSRKQSVGEDVLVSQAGEYAKADPLHALKTEVILSGKGTASSAGIASGAVGSPGTLTLIKSEQQEKNAGRPDFTDTWVKHESFTDPAGAPTVAALGGPDDTILNIVSVDYTLAESFGYSPEVTDVVLLDQTGVPSARQKCKHMATLTLKGRGAIASGIALGSGGAGAAEISAGKLLVPELSDEQIPDDFPSWDLSGKHYPLAS